MGRRRNSSGCLAVRGRWCAAAAGAMVIVASLAGHPAHAAPDQQAMISAAPATPNKLALVVGLGSPWGEMGISYQRRLDGRFAVESGVGLGATGVQVALLPKVLVGSGAAHLYAEAGPSLTLSDQSGAGVWAVGEAGFESSFGLWTLGFGGGVTILAAGAVRSPICFDACSTLRPGLWFPEIRLSVGRSF